MEFTTVRNRDRSRIHSSHRSIPPNNITIGWQRFLLLLCLAGLYAEPPGLFRADRNDHRDNWRTADDSYEEPNKPRDTKREDLDHLVDRLGSRGDCCPVHSSVQL